MERDLFDVFTLNNSAGELYALLSSFDGYLGFF